MTYYHETFVSEEENNTTVKNVFAIIGYIVMGIVLTLLFVWSYYASSNNQYLFITLLATIVLIYCIIVISITVVNKNCFDIPSYNIIFGITIFMLFMSFTLSIIFILKYFNVFSGFSSKNLSSSSSYPSIQRTTDTYPTY
jgi:chromate transport protein ChrA